MKKITLSAISLIFAMLMLAGCGAGYDVTLEKVKESDIAALKSYSFEAIVEQDGTTISYSVVKSGDWLKYTKDGNVSYFNLSEKRLYSVNEPEKKIYYADIDEANIPNAAEVFLAFNELLAEENETKWKKTGTETLDGNECEVYIGKSGLIDFSSATIYKLKGKSIYTKVFGKDASGKQLGLIHLKDMKIDNVDESYAKIPDGYDIEKGELQ